MECALNQLDSSIEITVETYRDDFELGAPARHVYHKLGFVDVDNTIFDHLGNLRYLDDGFTSTSIDYHITEPSPYESEDEFEWFVEQMRKALKI